MHAPPHTFRLLIWTWLLAVCLLTRCQELPTEPKAPNLDTDLPQVVADTAFLDEDSSVQIDVLKNDTSLVGDTLRLSQILRPPVHGTATIVSAQLNYVPNPNFNGVDSLTYQVTGALLPAPGQVYLNVAPVNDPPVAEDDKFEIEEAAGAPKALMANLDVLANDTDLDNDVLIVLQVNPPNVGQTAVIPGGAGIGYTPPAEFAGDVTFTYIVSDGQGGQDTAEVVVTVTAIDDAPVANDDAYSVNEDEVLTVFAPGILDNDFDAEGQPLTLALVDAPINGTLTLNPSGSFIYTPSPNFAGMDGFTYTVSDGLQTSDTANVQIDVIQVNDPPVAVNDTYSANAGETLIVQAPGILANDTDVENNRLTARLVGSVRNGVLDFRLDGSFIYTPNAGFVGDDAFTYRATDGENSNVATVTLRIRAVNTPPVAQDDAYSVTQNDTLRVAAPGLLANDTDADGDTSLRSLLGTAPVNGTLTLSTDGSFVYIPTPDFTGTDTFTYRTTDGTDESAPATVTITVKL